METSISQSKLLNGIVVGVLLSVAYVHFFWKPNHNTFANDITQNEDLPKKQLYIFQNNLHCKILYSTDSEDVEKGISLVNLMSDAPRALFDSGVDSEMKKIYEDDDTLEIQLVSTLGGIDTIVLDKTQGAFGRVSVGSLAGIYASASKGSCD